MKITCLLENTSAREELLPEHGLSLLIQTDTHRILFDMGQTDLFAQNAQKLGIDQAESVLKEISVNRNIYKMKNNN